MGWNHQLVRNEPVRNPPGMDWYISCQKSGNKKSPVMKPSGFFHGFWSNFIATENTTDFPQKGIFLAFRKGNGDPGYFREIEVGEIWFHLASLSGKTPKSWQDCHAGARVFFVSVSSTRGSGGVLIFAQQFFLAILVWHASGVRQWMQLMSLKQVVPFS